MLGVSAGDHATSRDIVISRSDDTGATWSTPSVLFGASAARSYHCAPTPTLVSGDGHLYRAFETGARDSTAFLVSSVAPIDASTDLLSPATWEMSSDVTLSDAMVPASWDPNAHFGWQEGNAVETNNTVYNVLRIDGQTNATHNKAAVLRMERPSASAAGAAPVLAFDRMIDFPSTSSKFVIRADPNSRSLLSLSTDVSPEAVAIGAVGARNHLSLVVSKPHSVHDWQACAVLLIDDSGFTTVDSARFTGFHYVDWIFDGDDILYAIRTGYRGANTYHNANRMTVKRLANYSALFDADTGECAWRSKYRSVGDGWCRPTAGWVHGSFGARVGDMECAQRCTEAGNACRSFANDPARGCSLYPSVANATSGEAGVSCYNKL